MLLKSLHVAGGQSILFLSLSFRLLFVTDAARRIRSIEKVSVKSYFRCLVLVVAMSIVTCISDLVMALRLESQIALVLPF